MTEQGGDRPPATEGGDAAQREPSAHSRSTRAESEQELRERLEEELRKVRVEEVVLQSVVSIINLTARRIAKEDERDLGQAKVGIDAVRALVEVIPADAAKQIRQALSELQMLYARQAEAAAEGAGREATEPETGGKATEPGEGTPPQQPRRPEPPPKLWTPPGSG